jgi:hypothetical protein
LNIPFRLRALGYSRHPSRANRSISLGSVTGR